MSPQEPLSITANVEQLRASGLFDADWYLSQNPDVAAAGADPLTHYLKIGADEGRNPNPLFDTDWYLAENPDVAAAGVNPLMHYLQFGAAEGRDPNPHFDTDWYHYQYPDVARARMNPLVHYLSHGAAEGRRTSPHNDVDPFAALYSNYWHQANGDFDAAVYGMLSERPVKAERCDVKLVAYYLPQFHPIPENDVWWGRGFTEWRNVAKAVPVFVGHYQPRLPGELGFYDLRVIDVLRRQVQLARLYGIHAFCFHFYWFGGKRLLEAPILSYLENADLDLPFCLCWANESWTRRWDGADSEVLLGQSHSPEDNLAFIRYAKRYFDDPRYLRIDGKPVLTVYRPALFPDARATAERWRSEAVRMGFPGIYLVATNSFSFSGHEWIGFDALSEFPPHGAQPSLISDSVKFVAPEHSGGVRYYRDYVQTEVTQNANVWPGVMPGWDNTARRQKRAHIIHGSTPRLFREWIDKAIVRARRNPPNQRFVMINAWNEWAEAAYLEPDRRFGYSYLAACGSSIADNGHADDDVCTLFAATRNDFRAKRPLAVVLHLFYEEMTKDFASWVGEFGEVDVYLTVPKDVSIENARDIVALFPGAYIQEVENRGRDMLPFLSILNVIREGGHRFVCKLHTKRSPLSSDGLRWCEDLVASLLSPAAREALCQTEDRQEIGVLAGHGSLESLRIKWIRESCVDHIELLADRIGVDVTFEESFVAGSMFWFRPEAMALFACLASKEDFEPELGQLDGTIAHALERMTIIAARAAGYDVAEIEAGPKVTPPYAVADDGAVALAAPNRTTLPKQKSGRSYAR